MSSQERVINPRLSSTQEVARVLWITLLLNFFVAALKIAIGYFTQTMVIMADGLHSLADGSSNIVGLIAMTISSAPPDKNHPYGHKKFETLGAALISFFLFGTAFMVAREAFLAFFKPKATVVTVLSVTIMVLTLLVNLFVVWFERAKGKALRSEFLLADSWHTLTDVFVTLTVFVALAGIALKIPYVDSIFSLGIAVVIAVTAIHILKHSTDVLVDKAVIEADKLSEIVLGVQGVLGCHNIRTRGKMDSVYVDMHVLVDKNMTVEVSHELANIIESRIINTYPEVSDVVVHIEPSTHDHAILGDNHP